MGSQEMKRSRQTALIGISIMILVLLIAALYSHAQGATPPTPYVVIKADTTGVGDYYYLYTPTLIGFDSVRNGKIYFSSGTGVSDAVLEDSLNMYNDTLAASGKFVNEIGDTMQGVLNMGDNDILGADSIEANAIYSAKANLGVVYANSIAPTFIDFDGKMIFGWGDIPEDSTEIGPIIRDTGDIRYLKLAGGTMSGNLNMGGHDIYNTDSFAADKLVATHTQAYTGDITYDLYADTLVANKLLSGDSVVIGTKLTFNGTTISAWSGLETTFEGFLDHNDLQGVSAAEHYDWTQALGGPTINSTNLPDLSGTYLTSEADPDLDNDTALTIGDGTDTSMVVTYDINATDGKMRYSSGYFQFDQSILLGSGADTVIYGSGSISGNGTLSLNSMIWPSTDGSNGQVLTTDGGGNLSWETPSSGTAESGAFGVSWDNNTNAPQKDAIYEWAKLFDPDYDGNLFDSSETVTGEWTFSIFPISPSAAPDADYEFANKKYVDDNIGTVNNSDTLGNALTVEAKGGSPGYLNLKYFGDSTYFHIFDSLIVLLDPNFVRIGADNADSVPVTKQFVRDTALGRIRDTAEVVIAETTDLDSANISDNGVALADINWDVEYIPGIPVGNDAPVDSFYQRPYGYKTQGNSYLVKDSAVIASTDTVRIRFDIPYDCTIDSVVFTYSQAGSGYAIDSLDLMGAASPPDFPLTTSQAKADINLTDAGDTRYVWDVDVSAVGSESMELLIVWVSGTAADLLFIHNACLVVQR